MKMVALVCPKNIQFHLQEKLSSSKLFTIQQKNCLSCLTKYFLLILPFFVRCLSVSGTKFLWCLFNFKALGETIIEWWSLKHRDTYFKVRETTHMKFRIFVIFSFQITVNNYHRDM